MPNTLEIPAPYLMKMALFHRFKRARHGGLLLFAIFAGCVAGMSPGPVHGADATPAGSADPSAPAEAPKFPSIKGHPIPAVAYCFDAPTQDRDPFVSSTLRGLATLVHPEKREEVAAVTGYDEKDFFNEVTNAAGRRLVVSAVVMSGEDGAEADRVVINQRAFATGQDFPVEVETSEPNEFIKYADQYKVPYLLLSNPTPARPGVKTGPPAARPVGRLCVFLEVGKVTNDGVNLEFPGGHVPLAFLPYRPVLNLLPKTGQGTATR